jgi:hypothetical protein
MATPEEYRERQNKVKRLEAELAELKQRFDLYLRGFERFPPMEDWEGMKKKVDALMMEASRWRTVDKFRMQTAKQKFLTYDRMWQREMKAVEEGTSRRDKFLKEKKRRQNAEIERHQAKATARRGGAKPDSGGMDDERMKRLYSVYMQAKKRTGESTKLSYDGLRAQLQKQIPAIKKKHGCKNVDFKVVLKNGKAMLKAVPK